MSAVAQFLVVLVATLHLCFLLLEMFLWDTATGRKTFKLSPEFAAQSKSLAANQGLYNGFLAAGLIWAILPVGLSGTPGAAAAIATFFLACVIVAGIFGAATVSRMIFWVQAAPAIVALAAIWAT